MLQAMWNVMEAMHAPSELALDQLDATLNPYRTRDNFVPMLARGLDLDWVFDERTDSQQASNISSELIPTGLGRVRALIAMASTLSQWRGTAKGLVWFLETATGIQGFTIHSSGGRDHSPRDLDRCRRNRCAGGASSPRAET